MTLGWPDCIFSCFHNKQVSVGQGEAKVNIFILLKLFRNPLQVCKLLTNTEPVALLLPGRLCFRQNRLRTDHVHRNTDTSPVSIMMMVLASKFNMSNTMLLPLLVVSIAMSVDWLLDMHLVSLEESPLLASLANLLTLPIIPMMQTTVQLKLLKSGKNLVTC